MDDDVIAGENELLDYEDEGNCDLSDHEVGKIDASLSDVEIDYETRSEISDEEEAINNIQECTAKKNNQLGESDNAAKNEVTQPVEKSKESSSSDMDKKATSSCTKLEEVDESTEKEFEKLLKTDFQDSKFFMMRTHDIYNICVSQHDGVWFTEPNIVKTLDETVKTIKNVVLIFCVKGTGRFFGFATVEGGCITDYPPADWDLPPIITSGGVFNIKWISQKELGFSKTKHLVNPLSGDKLVSLNGDGQEIDQKVGKELCGLIMDKGHHSFISDQHRDDSTNNKSRRETEKFGASSKESKELRPKNRRESGESSSKSVVASNKRKTGLTDDSSTKRSNKTSMGSPVEKSTKYQTDDTRLVSSSRPLINSGENQTLSRIRSTSPVKRVRIRGSRNPNSIRRPRSPARRSRVSQEKRQYPDKIRTTSRSRSPARISEIADRDLLSRERINSGSGRHYLRRAPPSPKRRRSREAANSSSYHDSRPTDRRARSSADRGRSRERDKHHSPSRRSPIRSDRLVNVVRNNQTVDAHSRRYSRSPRRSVSIDRGRSSEIGRSITYHRSVSPSSILPERRGKSPTPKSHSYHRIDSSARQSDFNSERLHSRERYMQDDSYHHHYSSRRSQSPPSRHKEYHQQNRLTRPLSVDRERSSSRSPIDHGFVMARSSNYNPQRKSRSRGSSYDRRSDFRSDRSPNKYRIQGEYTHESSINTRSLSRRSDTSLDRYPQIESSIKTKSHLPVYFPVRNSITPERYLSSNSEIQHLKASNTVRPHERHYDPTHEHSNRKSTTTSGNIYEDREFYYSGPIHKRGRSTERNSGRYSPLEPRKSSPEPYKYASKRTSDITPERYGSSELYKQESRYIHQSPNKLDARTGISSSHQKSQDFSGYAPRGESPPRRGDNARHRESEEARTAFIGRSSTSESTHNRISSQDIFKQGSGFVRHDSKQMSNVIPDREPYRNFNDEVPALSGRSEIQYYKSNIRSDSGRITGSLPHKEKSNFHIHQSEISSERHQPREPLYKGTNQRGLLVHENAQLPFAPSSLTSSLIPQTSRIPTKFTSNVEEKIGKGSVFNQQSFARNLQDDHDDYPLMTDESDDQDSDNPHNKEKYPSRIKIKQEPDVQQEDTMIQGHNPLDLIEQMHRDFIKSKKSSATMNKAQINPPNRVSTNKDSSSRRSRQQLRAYQRQQRYREGLERTSRERHPAERRESRMTPPARERTNQEPRHSSRERRSNDNQRKRYQEDLKHTSRDKPRGGGHSMNETAPKRHDLVSTNKQLGGQLSSSTGPTATTSARLPSLLDLPYPNTIGGGFPPPPTLSTFSQSTQIPQLSLRPQPLFQSQWTHSTPYTPNTAIPSESLLDANPTISALPVRPPQQNPPYFEHQFHPYNVFTPSVSNSTKRVSAPTNQQGLTLKTNRNNDRKQKPRREPQLRHIMTK